ncbi:PREDICTED: natural killer cell receptor 2B4 isoform X4 [Hipposideros armiger]|uniref:Natural killer cell receptor 2B4 isoform X4 n=1 Tax=Hipposideros armiger TaxID=186990 RepID=A0A8B7QKJ6_HIPAR|nr:PREDICTED: natural killer cell receptor 2B4 isoform X4 [Hipposideros armiger]
MLGQALTLTLLLLLNGPQGQEALAPVDCEVALAGTPLWLRPRSTQMMSGSVEWKVRLHSEPGMRVILEWKNASESDPVNWVSNNSNNRFSFMTKDLTLLINATQLQDSGLYSLEVTNIFGEVSTHKFCVSVFDHVGKPRLLEQWGALDRGVCQVTLSCSVSRGGNVSYAWYRGSDLIQTARNLSILEERIDPKDMHTYTCNVSNPVSWDSQTLRLTQGCLSAQQNFSFLLFLVTVVLLVTLSLSVLGCFFVHRRKRKQLQPSPEEVLTIYEQVHNLPVRRNHEQQQSPPGEGTTIYSRIQSQRPASTSQVMENTLYSMVQFSRKPGSKKRNHSPSFNNTIYEEVGRRHPKAQGPARLSQRELENFRVYS